MRRARLHGPAGSWPRDAARGSVTLDYDARHRRRILLELDDGEPVLLDLGRAVAMAAGDGLRLDDGDWIRVRAAAEPVLEVMAGDATRLARLAWHLGNRHVPAEIGRGVITIRPDHVLEELVVRLGATVQRAKRPFQPEGGAYHGNRGHHGS